MLRNLICAGMLATVGLASGAAKAATYRITEGGRPQVAGTVSVLDRGTAQDLGTVGAGDVVEVFGAIYSSQDSYKFTVTDPNGAEIDLFGGGLQREDGALGPLSTKTVRFDLGSSGPMGGSLLGGGLLRASTVADVDTGTGAQTIFTAGPGTYTLVLDGLGDSDGALYDVRISALTAAVPLPAPAALLLAGVVGLGALRRARRA